MTKGLWKIVGLGGIGAVIAIAAFAFDSKEEVAAAQGTDAKECRDLAFWDWEEMNHCVITVYDPPLRMESSVAPVDHEARAAVQEMIAQRNLEQVEVKHNPIPRALADFPIPSEIEDKSNVCSGIGGVLRCRVLPLPVIVSPTMYWRWSDPQTTYVLPVDATAADTPYGPHWYGPDGTPMSDPPRGTIREEN